MILLITFLQDIIKPPILPKILSDENNSNINVKIKYGQNDKRNRFFDAFVHNIIEEYTILPESLFDQKKLFQIYKDQIREKNNLSCAELFLYFLEFVIYYFKSDSVYVNCSIENEGYESIYFILNSVQKDVSKKDYRFAEYFKRQYFRERDSSNNNSKNKDGFILIRDPIDPHYNPAQTLKSTNYNTFMDNLKHGYFNLLKYGDFDQVSKDLKKWKEQLYDNI